MAELLDYIRWRGDLEMSASPFCDVDYAILCRMAYAPFGGVIDGSFSPQLTVREAAERLLTANKAAKAAAKDARFFRMEEDEELFSLAGASARFGGCRLAGFADTFSEAEEEQFSAVTFYLPDETLAVAFRGTDGTLVGWKEDFELAVSDTVPAQRDAVRYAENLAAAVKRRRIRLGGHSKGGNLAVYAAARCSARTRSRILAVRNLDGPGFLDAMLASPGYLAVADRIHTILPTSSVVGMLLEHAEGFSIIDSKSMGIFQHNMYRWQVMGGGFVFVDELTDSSRFVDATVKEWIESMTPEQRGKLVDGIFDIVGASDGRTLRELWEGRNLLAILKAAKNTDDETRALLAKCFELLGTAARSSFPLLIDWLRADERAARQDDGGRRLRPARS